jgi:hypothetical protein
MISRNVPYEGGRSRQGLPVRAIHNTASTKQAVILAAAAGIARLAETKRLHLRPLGVSQNESVHPELESQSSSHENPESQQTLVRLADDIARIARTLSAQGVRPN